MNNNVSHGKLKQMVRLAALTAIIILMAFTPLGYLKVGVVSITFIMIPVVIGAIIIGPAGGAILGAVFGATSFAQCFGLDAFGTTLMGLSPMSPVYVFIMCFVPRILMGWIVGIIFRAMQKVDKTKVMSYVVASLSGAVLNTALFVGALLLFFRNTEFLSQFGDSTIAILGVLVTFNAAIEAGVCLVVGTAISKTLRVVFREELKSFA
jgi:uncharacterized membrane protein